MGRANDRVGPPLDLPAGFISVHHPSPKFTPCPQVEVGKRVATQVKSQPQF